MLCSHTIPLFSSRLPPCVNIHVKILELNCDSWILYDLLILQSERAARKASVLQMATIYTAASGTLLNIGVTLSSVGNQPIANGSFIGAGE